MHEYNINPLYPTHPVLQYFAEAIRPTNAIIHG